MKKILISILIFCNPIIGTAQTESEINKFIQAYTNDNRLKIKSESIRFIKNADTNTPFIEEVELRAGIEQFDTKRQRYALRLKTTSWEQGKYEKKVLKSNLKLNYYKYKIMISILQKERYELIFTLKYLDKEISYLKKLQMVYQDKIKIMRNRVNSTNFNTNILIDAESNLFKTNIKLFEKQTHYQNVKGKIINYFPNININKMITEKIINPDHISESYLLVKKINKSNIYLKYFQERIELAKSRYSFNESSNDKLINFIQFSYDQNGQEETYNNKKNYQIEVGIKLPVTNNNQDSENNKKIKIYNEESKYFNFKNNLSGKINLLEKELKNLSKKNIFLKKQIKKSTLLKTYRLYSKIKGIDPLLLIKLKEKSLETNRVILDTEFRLYLKYIELLETKGIFSVYSKINFTKKISGDLLK